MAAGPQHSPPFGSGGAGELLSNRRLFGVAEALTLNGASQNQNKNAGIGMLTHSGGGASVNATVSQVLTQAAHAALAPATTTGAQHHGPGGGAGTGSPLRQVGRQGRVSSNSHSSPALHKGGSYAVGVGAGESPARGGAQDGHVGGVAGAGAGHLRK